MTAAAPERLVLAFVVAATGAGAGGTVWLLAGSTVPDWLLPLAAVAGLVAALGYRPAAPPAGEPAPRWLLAVAVFVITALAVVLAHGALATPSRHWDGAVAWDLKTAALGTAPTLAQPLFRDPTVYCHSRDYPLLQPLLMALGDRWHVPGRLLFPAAYLLLVAAVAAGARAAGAGGRWTILFALAAAVTPMWLSPTSGGFDSGYGDALLTAWLATVALGVATRNLPLVLAGLVLAILQKPEGLPYAGVFLAAVWLRGDARMLRAATFAVLVGGMLELALQQDLRSCGYTAIAAGTVAGAAAAAILLLALDAWLRHHDAGLRARCIGLLLLTPVAIWAASLGAGGEGGVLGAHLASATRPLQRLDRLPRVCLAIAEWGFGRGTFGLAFVVPIVVVAAQWRTRTTPRAPLLLAWLLLALPLWCVPFLTSPLEDLDRHLRSTLPRVMLHWTGVIWLWTALQPILCQSAQRALGAREPNP